LAAAPWDPLEETEWAESQDATYAPLVTLPNRRTEELPLESRPGLDLLRSARRAGLDAQIQK
ncbi:MAG: hypothetical protein QOI63_1170, partial [Thermoplasmata archaeon]|nr:hypothetical protein [Thermoplasmata archaeon]